MLIRIDAMMMALKVIQVIHWMRHGQTEMNVHLGSKFTPDTEFQDPLL